MLHVSVLNFGDHIPNHSPTVEKFHTQDCTFGVIFLPHFVLIGASFALTQLQTASVTKFGNFGALTPSTYRDQWKIFHATVNLRCAVPCKILPSSMHHVALATRSNKMDQIWNLWAPMFNHSRAMQKFGMEELT